MKMHSNQPTVLANLRCPYCGVAVTRKTSTKEHVIARNFVPIPYIDRSWNLILRACQPCNNVKSGLEDDISAISMQPNAFGVHAVSDEKLLADAARKARSRSRLTKKRVGESAASSELAFQIGANSNATISLVAPPQVGRERVFDLALYHLRAFFFLLTYNEQLRCGSPLPGVFMPLDCVRRDDWGNAIQASFMNLTHAWPYRLVHPDVANGFFKLAIRKHPTEFVWSWALEWNQNFRVVGFFGQEEGAQISAAMLPPGSHITRIREEIALDFNTDVMFGIPLAD